MISYIIKRLLWMIPTLFGITLITFVLMEISPGDPKSRELMFSGGGLSAEALAAVLAGPVQKPKLPDWYESFITWIDKDKEKDSTKDENGKDKNSTAAKTAREWGERGQRYFKWLGNLTRLDLGYSDKDKRPVITRIKEALPITIALNLITIFIVYLISIPLGVWSATKEKSLLDKAIMVKLFILYSLPTFWVASLLVAFFASADHFNWFPLMGYISDGAENWPFFKKMGNIAWHLVLPVVVSVYGSFAFLTRFTRVNFLEVIRQDYIRTARAKGLGEFKVIWKHAFRNSMIPLVTLTATLLPALLGGSIIIEQIFSIPGMGKLAFEAVLWKDSNVVMGLTFISAFLTLISLLIADIAYVIVDPRISYEGK